MINFGEYIQYTKKILDSVNHDPIYKAIELIEKTRQKQKTIYIIGNGGSAANASHFANDLCKYTRNSGPIKAISLTDNFSLISAYANDDGYDSIFEQQLKITSQPDDVLIAITCGGNSPNVLKALQYAKSTFMHTVGFLAYDGGKSKQYIDIPIHVEIDDIATSEGVHSLIMHYMAIQLLGKIV